MVFGAKIINADKTNEVFYNMDLTRKRLHNDLKMFYGLSNFIVCLMCQYSIIWNKSWWMRASCIMLLTAIEIAIRDSVTVSIGDEWRGALREIFFVTAKVRSCLECTGFNDDLQHFLYALSLKCRVSVSNDEYIFFVCKCWLANVNQSQPGKYIINTPRPASWPPLIPNKYFGMCRHSTK